VTPEQELSALLDTLREDCLEWRGLFGQRCLEVSRRQGSRAVTPVAELLATHRENYVRLHCVYLLTNIESQEATAAITAALDLPLDDEVLEQIFEDAAGSAWLRAHAPFLSKARGLFPRWPNPSLREFLLRIDGDVH
jgi:hypothetical protein